MCAIAGIVRFDQPAELSREVVALMLHRMRHRGPDDSGAAILSRAVLGNARLSLLDRTHGSQPMRSPDGRWHLTYNGEVYNWQELRRELREDWNFVSECDTEVVLAALATWGETALQRFNGMFALFLWDDQNQTGLGARDRLGVKPFSFLCQQGVFAFSSEAKALLPFLSQVRADMDAVLEYLVAPYFSGVERSMFAGIQYLQPGQWLRVFRAGLVTETWWDWPRLQDSDLTESQLTSALREEIQQAVAQTLRADHPMSSFLSGGLDSTLLSSLAVRNGARDLRTFTVRFQDQDRFDYGRSLIVREDDLPHAEAAARALATKHSVVNVSRASLAEDLCCLARVNDALPAWEQELAQHHLSRAVAESGMRCVLVGDAADETHYGYPFLLDQVVTEAPEQILLRFGLPPLCAELCGSKTFRRLAQGYQALTDEAGHGWNTPAARLLATTYLIVKRWLPRLLHNGDIHTMSFSVEARVPFADIHVLDIAAKVHPDFGLRRGCEKSLLRRAAKGLMPDANRLRRKSALPKDQATAEIYQREAATALKGSSQFLSAWLDLKCLHDLCQADRIPSEFERALLFRVIALHHWQQQYNVCLP